MLSLGGELVLVDQPSEPVASTYTSRVEVHQPPVPGEQRGRRHAEACPPGAGEQAAEHDKERPVGRVEGRSLDLAPQHGHVVAKCQQLGLLGAIRAGEEDDEFEKVADGEVSKGSELPSCSVPTHCRGR
jgi:hypothetical protein